jgi:hypothetical protein
MKLSLAFPSRYLKADDLPKTGTKAAKIKSVDLEEVGMDREKKLVISFHGMTKQLIVNKTNANSIAKVTGSEDTDDWVGKTIHLFRTTAQFGAEECECIRVKTNPTALAPAAETGEPEPDDGDNCPY